MTFPKSAWLAFAVVFSTGTLQTNLAFAEETGEQACAAYFSELHDGVLGTLRGTEHIYFSSHVASVAEKTHGTNVMVPSFVCESGLKSLRNKRKADSSSARTLGPACAALVEHIDNDCLQPLIESGKGMSDACAQTLYGLSASPADLGEQMADDDFCKS